MPARLPAVLLAAALLVGLAPAPPPAGADEPAPSCTRPALGETRCFTARLCACVYDRGGAMTGTPPGYRWDCGIHRPSCGEAANVPVTIQEFRGQPPAYPLAVGIDRRR